MIAPVYTWLVELKFGLAGVLSTVTMADPKGVTISTRLIRLRNNDWNLLFLSTVNSALRHPIKCKRSAEGRSSCSRTVPADSVDSRLLKREQIPLKSQIERGRHVQFADGSYRGSRPDDGKGRAGHDRARPCIHGARAFLGLQSGQTLVAQERTHYRHLLLVLRAGIRSHLPHRAIGAGRCSGLQHSRRRRTDRVLRQWPWAAVGTSALGAGDIVPRCI